ncbi:Hypothetical predicted protein [Olea europaea subsp. europaea]|uniref:FH2 domain-containing protein n=1 Tax=Olea europaea subsp. europaea TaxID=158383 RepID=A0A8S0UZX5_OLEEU|nr:Hypothetical predicted protein [Olea europaea subsp. europaea]
MRPRFMIAFLILSLITYFKLQITKGEEHRFQDSHGGKKKRRILHQPLFPASSAPPPQSELSPPPPPDRPESPDQDQPFFHELPNGSTPDQVQQSPQAPASGTTVGNPVVTQPSKPAKKLAIAISVGIVTLGMFSALAFYLYKHRVKHSDVSQKLVSGNSQRINEDPGVGPSTFLYVGTVEPAITRSVSETNVVNISPSQNLKSIERSDQKRYRPSPDLQPLPPLNKPPPPPSINLSPPMSSSDDESHDTTFYSAHASSVSNMSPSSRHSYPSNNSSVMHQARPDHVVPQPKITSPKSRLSMSSPDTKHAIIPTTNELLPPYPFPSPRPPPPPPPPPLPPAASSLESLKQSEGKPSISAQPYIPKRPKFSAPPPPPDIGRLQWINNDVQQASKIPVPPPPPMPTSRKLSTVKNTPSLASTLIRSQSRSPSPRATPRIKKTSPVEEVDTGVSSSEKQDAEDSEGSKPKLKPFHWDKVRTTSDRATVWDQLNSSSFQLNEDAMESLFGWSSANSVPKEATRKSVLPPLEMENRVLDPKKSQNIAILLRALNVTRDEVSEALLDGNPDGLGADLLETLVKMTPTKEEEIKLKDYNGDISKLGTAERFLKAVLDIPFAFKRVEAMLYRANFDTEVKYLRKSFLTIEVLSIIPFSLVVEMTRHVKEIVQVHACIVIT